MTLAAVKEKLHEYIDNADAKKAKAIFAILENELSGTGNVIDDATLGMLNQRWNDYLSGKSKNFSLEESMERIRQHRAKNGI